MQIDFNYTFKNLDGKEIKEPPKEGEKKGKPFTLRKACVRALLDISGDQIVCPNCKYQLERAEELSGEKKIERYEFAKRLHNSNGLVDLQSEDITFLKKLIAKGYPPLTVGQAWEILDPTDAGNKK